MCTKVALSIALALVLALAACGGGPPDAAKVYADAGEKMAALTSYHMTGEERGEGGVIATFEADFVPPDKFQLTQDDSILISIGNQIYLSPPESPDYFTVPQDQFSGPVDAAAFLTALTTQISDLTYLGEEAIGGVSTHHLQGTLAAELLELVEAGEEHTGSVTLDLWVGVEDSLVYRYLWLEAGQTTTLTLSRFDEPITIAAPANPRSAAELFAEQFKQQIASLPAEQEDCLRRVLGDDVFAEFEAGIRMPTEEEFAKGDECFR